MINQLLCNYRYTKYFAGRIKGSAKGCKAQVMRGAHTLDTEHHQLPVVGIQKLQWWEVFLYLLFFFYENVFL
jgi:hypothetical protein